MKTETKILTGLLTLAIIIGGILFFQSKNTSSVENSNSTSRRELIPVNSITHGHGLAVDITDPNKLYIATHHGLLVLVNEKDLYQVGEKKDDYMGFSLHPKDAKVFFTSGHPSSGGNLGFQKSDDGGYNWEKISDGIGGPVDFHAMTVSPVNPDLIFGWYQGALQRTADGGRNWEIIQNTQFPITGLATDTKDENVVYAASPQGLFVSRDKGGSFDQLLDGFVSAIAINFTNPLELLSFSEKHGLAKSIDGGKLWETAEANLSGETPLYISFSKKDSKIVYLLTEKNSIYKSDDSGVAWTRIR